MLIQDDHRWCRERIAAHEVGLLSGSPEADRFASHLRSCPACREAVLEFRAREIPAMSENERGEGVRPVSGNRGGPVEHVESWEHVPESILARWPESKKRLRGLERAMVRAHLEHCETCRADLEHLGHAPGFEDELAPEIAPSPDRPRRIGFLQSPWVRWGVAGWAAAATVALAVMVYQADVSAPLTGRQPPGQDAGQPPGQDAASRPAAATVTSAELAPVVSLSVQRGGEPQTVSIRPETRVLVVGGPDFPTTGSYEIEVFGPDGGSILRATVQAAGGNGVVLTQPRPWEPGLYKILLDAATHEGEHPATVTFVVRLRVDG